MPATVQGAFILAFLEAITTDDQSFGNEILSNTIENALRVPPSTWVYGTFNTLILSNPFVYASFINCFGYPPNLVVNPVPVFLPSYYHTSVAQEKILEYTAYTKSGAEYLIHSFLFGKAVPPTVKNAYRNLLDQAPCTGPYNFATPNNRPQQAANDGFPAAPNLEWCSVNRLDNYHNILDLLDQDASDGISGEGIRPGEYSGLDYMLLHNLFALIDHPNSFFGDMQLQDVYLNQEFPQVIQSNQGPDYCYGCSSLPADYLYWAENVYVNLTLNPGAKVTIKGKNVELLSGQAPPGTELIIEENGFPHCQTDGTYKNAIHLNDSALVARHLSKPIEERNSTLVNENVITVPRRDQVPLSLAKPSLSKDNYSTQPLEISPNPGNGKYYLRFHSDNIPEMKLFNSYGVLLTKVKFRELSHGYLELDISSQPSGVYMLHALFDGTSYSFKVIKSQ
jgi:hypothetical protein